MRKRYLIVSVAIGSMLLSGCATMSGKAFEDRFIRGNEIAEQKDQYTLLSHCERYGKLKRYQDLEICLSRLQTSLDRHGEMLPSRKWLKVWAHEVPHDKYPIAPRISLLAAEQALDFGHYRQAFNSAKEAERLYKLLTDEYWSLLSDMPDYPLYRSELRTEITGIAAIAAYRMGDVNEAQRRLVAFDLAVDEFKKDVGKIMGLYLSKEVKSMLLAMRARVLLGTEQGRNAYEMLLADDSYALQRVSELLRASVMLAFGAALASIPGGQPSALNTIQYVFGVADAFKGAISSPYSLPSKFQLAHLRVEAGKHAEALPMFEEMLSDKALPSFAGLHWAVLYDRGRIAEAQRQPEQAIQYYQRAVDEIENVRSSINSEASRIGFIGDKQDAYRALIRLLFEQGRHGDAFVITERAKSRALVDLLAEKSATELSAKPAERARLANLIEVQKKSDRVLQSDGGAVEFRDEPSSDAKRSVPPSETRFAEIREAYVAKTHEAQQHVDAKLSSMVQVPRLGLPELRQQLPANAALLGFFGDGDVLYAFVVTQADVRGVRLAGKDLSLRIESFRKQLEDQSSDTYLTTARQLYKELLASALNGVDKERLIIASHGALHHLPYAALHDGERFLFERYRLSHVPSATILQYLRPVTTDKAGSVLALGNPTFDLINAEKEVKEIAANFDASSVLIQLEATPSVFFAKAPSFRFLHLAAHGVFVPENPLASYIQLAPATTASNVLDSRETGYLKAGDLYGQSFAAEMVTLSACQSALVGISNGDDILGLVRGFLYAGARSVTASLWRVNDLATQKLMVRFYEEIRLGQPKDVALQTAQQVVRSEGWSHPSYWAAFQLSGKSD